MGQIMKEDVRKSKMAMEEYKMKKEEEGKGHLEGGDKRKESERINSLFPLVTIHMINSFEEKGSYENGLLDTVFLDLLEIIEQLADILSLYLKESSKSHEYPVIRTASSSNTHAQDKQQADYQWPWLTSHDPDILIINQNNFNFDLYNRNTFLIALNLLAKRIQEWHSFKNKFFQILNTLIQKCIDEQIILCTLKILRKVITDNVIHVTN